MKILIIGGTGFIGKPLTRMFVQNGHEVALFHRNKVTSDANLSTIEIMDTRDNILHHKNEFLSFKPDLAIDIIPYTAQDTWRLTMALKDVTENLLVLSSGDVYKVYDTFHRNLPGVDNSPLTETSELRNRLYPYKPDHVDKYDEQLFNYDKIIVETMAQGKNFNTCILRLPALFGEGDKQQKLSEYIIPMVTNQGSIILSSKKANWIWTRSYVENITYGIYLAAINEKARNDIFNLGDINLKEFDLVTTLKRLTDWKGEIIIQENISEPFNYEQNIIMDSSKIKKVLNYSAPINDELAFFEDNSILPPTFVNPAVSGSCMRPTKRKIVKRISWTLVMIFILMNFVAYFHAYKFTHFADSNVSKTKDAKKLSAADKIKTLFFGINNPRPTNTITPTQKFETIKLQSNKTIECWNIKTDGAKGTVILFHGYGGQKSMMLDKSAEFIRLGYNTLLVDFMGSGGSEGNQTTLGFKEAEEVKTCFDYLTNKGEKKIYLFGTSLGAVAILKAISDYNIKPQGIIIECPFGSMYQTTCARFNSMQVPSFPMAGLLVFWGGIQNGFWAFGHKPTEYAKAVKCPTLLLYGEKDEKVSREEIDQVYSNLACKKSFKSYPLAGHENYLTRYKQEWIQDIRTFMQTAIE